MLCIDYRLAPEHPFPAALDDAISAYRWLLADGAAPARTAVMGDSAGGGLVLATLLRLRDEGLPLPGAAVVMSPWTDLALTGASLRTNAAAAPMLKAEQAPTLASYYLGGADPRNPYASPLYGDPAGLPPTLIQVGSDEILRDDAVRMADKMRASGCRVEIVVWPRMPHVWQMLRGSCRRPAKPSSGSAPSCGRNWGLAECREEQRRLQRHRFAIPQLATSHILPWPRPTPRRHAPGCID